ncbi:hypothetical protein JB92DRAFT_1889564 [Gautieria morchelliformis]|nr:hypothetical protein JB92DRAFT_1889564 [Gautieria morchelliformis]
MVDLYGNPSCSECFDTCLDRKDTHRKPLEAANNMGGMRGKSRESSPALEELSERLGIKRQVSPEVNRSPSRETSYCPSPIRPSLSSRKDDSLRSFRQVSPEVNRSISERSVSPSPLRMFSSSHQEDSLRLRSSLGGSRSGTPPRQTKISGLSVTTSAPSRSKTSKSVMPTMPTTPDLFSCSSSSDSLSSPAPSTPSNSPRQSLTSNSDSITPKAKGVLKVVTTGDAKCGRCFQSLFSISGEGQIVTVPDDSHKGFPASYHASCFRCFVCGDIFDGKDQGRATFLKDSRGVCHPEVCVSHIPITSFSKS